MAGQNTRGRANIRGRANKRGSAKYTWQGHHTHAKPP